MRGIAINNQTEEAQLFYPLRDVARHFHVTLSTIGRIYDQLEEEGILVSVRGSKTLLQGLSSGRHLSVLGFLGTGFLLFVAALVILYLLLRGRRAAAGNVLLVALGLGVAYCLVLLIFFMLTTSYVNAVQKLVPLPTVAAEQQRTKVIRAEDVKKMMVRVEARTDKVNAEIPSPVTGTVEALLVREGEQVTAGQPIARVAAD